ncbi:lysophospholipid acyltransferase family protein [Basilea psittacipulmonis]|uniref:Acyl-phosphate glycerol 3-phosphate acyltransferase n=1 Tax=Basilea psittacipulmonis DSM 24701 TaxID=1072685 RepID=A0A077DEV3_9BURK|nr:lysophospholipid acyltransferase family protein [Basilea psittacipulmonis]AIL33259.1 acyl-phosphate glycerol 3-phosphate acyltransferase [Basilea psittacipulmonis DSM 24701]
MTSKWSLNRVWRSIATAIGFFTFGFFSVLLVKILLIPFIYRKPSLKNQLAARRFISKIWWFYIHFLKFIGALDFKFIGQEKLGRPGQVIICNHPSLLDVVFMFSHIKTSNCVVKESLSRNIFLNSPIRACGFIPNNGSIEMLDQCASILQNGESLLIFPEGTRTQQDGKIQFHRGACAIAVRGAKVITPVVIKMHPPALKKGQAWYKAPEKKIFYEFIVGEDIDPQDWLKEKPIPIATRKLNTFLENYFIEELKK